MDAKKIWSYARRLLAIIPSIFICALGVALLVWPEWGCDPLTTFEIGLSNVFHVQFGTVALVFEGIHCFLYFSLLSKRFGTFRNSCMVLFNRTF